MKNKQTVLILYSKLSDYMLNMFSYWVEQSDVEIHILHDAIDMKEAPYKFSEYSEKIFLYENNISYQKMLELSYKVNPTMILCSGWANKKYLMVVLKYRKQDLTKILTLDNQWFNTFKQKIASHISNLTLKRIFDYVWVPGDKQIEYAKRLGFSQEQIFDKYYIANEDIFCQYQPDFSNKKSRRFIFVGRYVEIKGVMDLWQAFVKLQDELPNDWELICIGTGPLVEKKIEHDKIKHVGFVQPHELCTYLEDGGVFILPSHFEPWGLVVHEFAFAGFPMIISDTVGAKDAYLENNKNGFVFKNKNVDDLKEKMLKIVNMDNVQLQEMGELSIKKAKTSTKEDWLQIANRMLNVNP